MGAGTGGGERLMAGGVLWHAGAAEAGRLRGWLERHFPAVLERRASLLKSDTGSRVAAADGLVLKESTARRGRASLRFGLRRSGSRRAFLLAGELAAGGIPTPKPVAWATVRRGGLRACDYLITEFIPDARILTEHLRAIRPDTERAAAILQQLGGLLGRFHSAGWSNRDMKDYNVMVTERPGLRLWVVDLDGVRRWVIGRGRTEKDFWPVVRSLRLYGWTGPVVDEPLLAGYNAAAPARLRLKRCPCGDRPVKPLPEAWHL